MIDVKTILPAIKGYVVGWIHSYMNVSVRVYNDAAISVSDATLTALTFNTERWDTAGMHSTTTNTSRLTCTIAGKYLIGGHVEFAANATGNRRLLIKIDATYYIGSIRVATIPAVSTSLSITSMFDLDVDDYVELFVFQDSGGNLDINSTTAHSPEFWMQRVS